MKLAGEPSRNSRLEVSELDFAPIKNGNKVLDSISCSFAERKIYGILGPNGSGKTTLMRHILRLLDPKRGKVELCEKDIKTIALEQYAKQIAFVPQKTTLDADFTVYDIVAMGRTPFKHRFEGLTKKDKDLIDEALFVTQTSHLKDRYYNLLSGGEAQRVLIARAIAQDTPWLVLDEPIASLDIKYQVQIMHTLKEMNEKRSRTILVILHDINLASEYCDEVILMKDGKIYKQGPTSEVLTIKHLKEVYEIEFFAEQSKHTGNIYFIPNNKFGV